MTTEQIMEAIQEREQIQYPNIQFIHKEVSHWNPKKENLFEVLDIINKFHENPGFHIVGKIDQPFGRLRFYLGIRGEFLCNDGRYRERREDIYYSRAFINCFEREEIERKYDQKYHPEYHEVLFATSLSMVLSELNRNIYNNSALTESLKMFINSLNDYSFRNSYYTRARQHIEHQEKQAEETRKKFENIYGTHTQIKKRKVQKTYLMYDKHTGFYKIGKSYDPKFREKTLMSVKPTIELIWSCRQDIERYLHSKYADKRVRGEWFQLSEKEIEEIKSSSKTSKA